MMIRNIMTPGPVTVHPGVSLETARQLMERGQFRSLPVTDDSETLVGIITSRDILRYAHSLETVRVDEAMTRDPKTIGPDASVEEAAIIILEYKFGGLPVLDSGRPIGIVTTTDILRAFLRVEQATRKILDD